MSTTRYAITGETRGAILVAAVFMAVLLVGALWYVIGIGDAIAHRQQMQDAADAVAYTGAVYHARGMNLIAMVNVIMAGVLAVLVALKLVQALNLAALLLSCAASALCGVGVGCWAVPICSFTSNLQPQIATAIDRYESGVVRTVLPALSAAQRGIARAMPWVAQAKAASVAASHGYPPIRAGGILSTSLLPHHPEARLGLPVQEDGYTALCTRAGEDVASVAFEPFPFAGWLEGVTVGVVEGFPDYFCEGKGELAIAQDREAIDEQCELRKEACEQGSDCDFDVDDCRDSVRRELRQEASGHADGLQEAGLDQRRMTPKGVFAGGRNGDSFFQIWGLVAAEPDGLRAAERGVKVATWGKAVQGPGVQWGRLSFAQAEFYYDTQRGWDAVREEALWNMRWRARLRRVRPPQASAATIIAAVSGKLPSELAALLAASAEGCATLAPGCEARRGRDQFTRSLVGLDPVRDSRNLEGASHLEVIH